MRVGEQSTDPIDQVLGEVPVPASLTPEDVRLAVRAVVVHTAEEWPSGALCRNDGASYPCRLHRWGRRVLEAHGLNGRQIDALIRHGNPFVHVPFPFTATGPSRADRPAAHPAATQSGRGATPPGRAANPGGRTPMPPGRVSASGGRMPTPPGRMPTPPGRMPTPPGRVPTPPGRVPTPPGRVPPAPGRVSVPTGRPVVRPGLPSRPVPPNAAAPRWPRAS
ncbi:hypothetical protein GA0070558_10171 [Micromonospora haikouensis]|uniref:Uncharacterized protein n=1 Tax=Micromonospora haikouensis TaxID=686309 RepID=A0A0D0X7B9_9ACTN|nr:MULTISPECIES: hypothetical protein [unclassified Micromonospora]KIR65370.1 hypothetical protein TK50_08025 [Micromonospora haikouensis]SCE63719.1 hypothetical protein GA0070558_10171 [Micromonospora haikouensis]